MIKADVDALIDGLGKMAATKGCHFILTDTPMIPYLAKTCLEKAKFKRIENIEGKTGLFSSLVNFFSQRSLFDESQASIVTFKDSLTEKQWAQELSSLSRLPSRLDFTSFVFAPTGFRHVLTKHPFDDRFGKTYLVYSPQSPQLSKCIFSLIRLFPQLESKTTREKNHFCETLQHFYQDDLISIYAHLQRMVDHDLSIDAAFVGEQPNLQAFHVTEVMSQGQPGKLLLCLEQCAANEIEIGNVFMVIVMFMKQLAIIHSELAQNPKSSLSHVFEKCRIPFPSQKKLQSALNFFSPSAVLNFFLAAPLIEKELRLQKKPYDFLSMELIQLYSKN